MIAGLAVLPATLPAPVLAATAEPDPIFAAIQVCITAQQNADEAYARVNRLLASARERFGAGDDQRRARHAFVERTLGCDEDAYTDGPSAILWDAYHNFADTVPTTLAGLFAMLIFADGIEQRGDLVLDDMTILSRFATAAEILGGGAA
ncbi:hypothetical protein [Bradyrhizobium sp. McL0616]|uniref:hypothetical protein n=1 Tax=Bradyrhizobium sp. McL0616 TaxID=3415674 RepID=UPI003CFB6A67